MTFKVEPWLDDKPEIVKLKRPCNKCDKMFMPTSKAQRVCDDCKRKLHKGGCLKGKTYKRYIDRALDGTL